MPLLPVISGQQARRALERMGWRFIRQRGSHMILVKAGFRANLVIPDHKELDRGTLRTLIRVAEIAVEQFINMLNSL